MVGIAAWIVRIVWLAVGLHGLSIVALDLDGEQEWLNSRLGIMWTQLEFALTFGLIAALGLGAQAQLAAFRLRRQRPHLKLEILPDDGSGVQYVQVTCSRTSAKVEAVVAPENRDEFDGWPHRTVHARWDGLNGRYAEINAGGHERIRLAEFVNTAPSSITPAFAHWFIPVVNPDGSDSGANTYSWIPGFPDSHELPDYVIRLEFVTDPPLTRAPMVRRLRLTADGVAFEPNLGIRIARRVPILGRRLGR